MMRSGSSDIDPRGPKLRAAATALLLHDTGISLTLDHPRHHARRRGFKTNLDPRSSMTHENGTVLTPSGITASSIYNS